MDHIQVVRSLDSHPNSAILSPSLGGVWADSVMHSRLWMPQSDLLLTLLVGGKPFSDVRVRKGNQEFLSSH